MDNLNNVDTMELAKTLYKMSSDLDFLDYEETKTSTINIIEETLYNLKNYAILNPSANKGLAILLTCLDTIASHN